MPRMTAKFSRASFVLLWVFLCFVSCSSTPFFRQPREVPEEKITALADQIEEAVINTRLEDPSASDYNIDERTGRVVGDLEPLNLLFNAEQVRANVPALAELNVDNEVVVSAIRGRILRRPAVYELQQKGCVGEAHNGLLKNLKSRACAEDRAEKDRVANIVLMENRNRTTIYEQVAEANDLGGSGLSVVRGIFREQIYKKAWAGTPLQKPDGTWETR